MDGWCSLSIGLAIGANIPSPLGERPCFDGRATCCGGLLAVPWLTPRAVSGIMSPLVSRNKVTAANEAEQET